MVETSESTETTLINVAYATDLVYKALKTVGFSDAESSEITPHLIDCELRGVKYGGLARAVSILERVSDPDYRCQDFSTSYTSDVIASIDGGNKPGYLVAQHAVRIGLEMAKKQGMCTIGAFNTWYSGMLSYYLEQITAEGLIGIMTAAGPPRVAPHGGSESMFGTNPFAIGVPTSDYPVILDLGTSSIMFAEVVLAGRLDQDLPEGRAFDESGKPTVDPSRALSGAFAPWGGHKGSGLAMFMHLIGMAVGHGLGDEKHNSDASFMLIIIDPRKFFGGDSFPERASAFADMVRNSRPSDSSRPVRMPFDRSIQLREATEKVGAFDVSSEILEMLEKAAAQAT